MPFPTLHTDRLILRELGKADADALLAIYADPEAMRWFGADVLHNRSQVLHLIEAFARWRHEANPGTRWGLCRIEDEAQIIGSVGLFKWNRSWRNAVVGYELNRAHWGQGLMQEALSAVLGYGFKKMELNRVQAEIHPDNLASIRLVQGLHFYFEGLHRQQGFWGGRFHDLACYSLLAQDWNKST